MCRLAKRGNVEVAVNGVSVRQVGGNGRTDVGRQNRVDDIYIGTYLPTYLPGGTGNGTCTLKRDAHNRGVSFRRL